MNDHPSALFSVSYRMERRDYVAMILALSRRQGGRLAFEIAGFVAIIALLALALAGSTARWFDTIVGALSLPMAFATVPLLLAGPVVLALRPQINGMVAALAYPRSGLADRETSVHLTADGIEGGATGVHSRYGWAAVTGLAETQEHLIIQVSRREALIIPRRAVSDEDTYRNLIGFVRARTGLSTR